MLAIVVMLSSCGVMNKIDNTDLLSTKPPQSEKTSDWYQQRPPTAVGIFITGVIACAVFRMVLSCV